MDLLSGVVFLRIMVYRAYHFKKSIPNWPLLKSREHPNLYDIYSPVLGYENESAGFQSSNISQLRFLDGKVLHFSTDNSLSLDG